MGLGVVVEGIEDEATWRRMTQLGADIGQGYWLSRPLRPEAVPDWMREGLVGLVVYDGDSEGLANLGEFREWRAAAVLAL